MIQVRNTKTGEIQNASSMDQYPDPEWVKIADIPAGLTLDEVSLFSAGAVDLVKMKALFISRVKDQKATRLAAAYTTVFGKQKIYSRKQEEVNAFRALAPLVTNLTTIVNTVAYTSLGVANQRDKFRFAMAEAALRGVSVGVVINEYAAKIDSVEPQSAAWEAIEQVACSAIRAATSPAQVKSIYVGINWGWTAP